MIGLDILLGHLVGDYVVQNDWMAANKTKSSLACTVHCAAYTASVWAFSFYWITWWGLLVCFLAHWPVDRFRLARRWMDRVGQKEFASGIFSPWSIILVDNILHLIVLRLIYIGCV